MKFKDFQELVKDTRTTRRFKKGISISKDELLELIDLARVTSSPLNKQPLRYIPIVDEKVKEEVYKPLKWAAHLQEWNQSEDEKPSAYILMINDTRCEGFSMIDSGISMQTIALGANIKGYSACMMASIDKEQYKQLFNLPRYMEPLFMIALGVQNEEIKLVNVQNDDTNYYREGEVHCVPKRALVDIIFDENR